MGKGWFAKGQERHHSFERQQGSIIIWAGILGDEIMGPFRVPNRVKIISASYCQIFQSNVFL